MTITICRADEVVEKVKALHPGAVLSIEHPGVKPGEKGYAPRLMDGTPHSATADTPQMILTFWDTEDKRVPQGPDREQVKRGLEFILPHVAAGENVIIHCQAGISRSTAMALGVLSTLNPQDDEKTLIKKLLALRPQAAPNIIVVGLVDELTGRHGKLLKAVLDNPQFTAARAMVNLGRLAWRQAHPEKFPPKQKLRAPQFKP